MLPEVDKQASNHVSTRRPPCLRWRSSTNYHQVMSYWPLDLENSGSVRVVRFEPKFDQMATKWDKTVIFKEVFFGTFYILSIFKSPILCIPFGAKSGIPRSVIYYSNGQQAISGYVKLGIQIGSDWPPNVTNLGLFKISFSTFWLGEPKWTDNYWS